MAVAVVAFCAPAFAAVPKAPVIAATQTTFTIPTPGTATWMLRLWSHGTMEGSASSTSGTLTVPVPATSDCAFQADVSVTPVGGTRYFYSGARATVPGCGPVKQTITGDIFVCTAAGAPTTTEQSGGTLAATGPQMLPSQPNPVAPTTVASGTYTMTATPPSGFAFVSCGGPATVDSSGLNASQSVTVPAGGQGVGNFYVVAQVPAGSLGGGSGPPGGTGSGSGPPTSPGSSGPKTSSSPSKATPSVVKASSPGLAFTGLDIVPLVLAGLLALVLGTLATLSSRRRRLATVDRTSPRR